MTIVIFDLLSFGYHDFGVGGQTMYEMQNEACKRPSCLPILRARRGVVWGLEFTILCISCVAVSET